MDYDNHLPLPKHTSHLRVQVQDTELVKAITLSLELLWNDNDTNANHGSNLDAVMDPTEPGKDPNYGSPGDKIITHLLPAVKEYKMKGRPFPTLLINPELGEHVSLASPLP